ncbi:aromatic amino acid aminotransferase gamma [Fructobacillus pseudoficulneus]|uniref:Aminotransferase n=1 Tax=Fructobacillus pseudoficulneus TaxID=220714 RepID=A0A3F3H767_9LACO|nr:aminotransferase class I/II-fold pyridoxal phosphate-dependent enzyme [Fructobacillus pseudoficulneus]GAP02619.1 aromatic amino acid aminotransferase gamma [Fructobacillus pseudoficulneus]SEH38603.1 aminotransferase [Fructobacillus pseudoficulneus]
MTEPVLPINREVKDLEADKLLGFQMSVAGIEGITFLTFGEPGFDTPTVVKEATKAAIDGNRSHYGNSQGEPAVRQAVLDYMKDRYDLDYPGIENVVITLGVTEAMQAIFKTLLQRGDGLLIPEPAYGSYFASLSLAGGVAVSVDTTNNGFKLTPALVDEAVAKATVPVRAVLLNYPSNPTGVTYTEAEITALAACFKKHGIWVISDEIYSELTYEQEHFSIGKLLPEQSLVVNGLSKSHAMTGYRLGFILGSADVIQYVQKVHGSLTYSAPTFIEDGAVAALKMSRQDLQYMTDSYEERRDFSRQALEELGFDVVDPEGAFYLFAKIPADFGTDGWAFAEKLAHEGKVAVIPRAAFSHFEDANQYIRISYAASQEQLTEGFAKLKAYVEKARANR